MCELIVNQRQVQHSSQMNHIQKNTKKCVDQMQTENWLADARSESSLCH